MPGRHGLPFRAARHIRAICGLQQQREPTRGALSHEFPRAVDQRPYLDSTALGFRDIAGQCQGVIEIVRFQHVVAVRNFGALGERAIGDDRSIGSAGDTDAIGLRIQGISGADRRCRLGLKIQVVGQFLSSLVGCALLLRAYEQCEVIHGEALRLCSVSGTLRSTLYLSDEQRIIDPTSCGR
ncbi:Uncharacterised protein [Mycobacteroides abscessus subsp. abscessus]|nr:Uncharacterised protein [Mycobacteroides abscessus subsp. abscessus]